MTHYVCTGGCNGVSDEPNATCQSESCSKYSEQLTPCNCEDDSHDEVLNSDNNMSEESGEEY